MLALEEIFDPQEFFRILFHKYNGKTGCEITFSPPQAVAMARAPV
jgi:hypothetical protein